MMRAKGIKRQIVTDIMGNLLCCKVHAANEHDSIYGIIPLKIASEKYKGIKMVSADGGYRGTFVHSVYEQLGIGVEISKKIELHSWQVIPKRWIVERTFGWLNFSRRLSKDYEITSSSEEAMVKISHIFTLLRRL